MNKLTASKLATLIKTNCSKRRGFTLKGSPIPWLVHLYFFEFPYSRTSSMSSNKWNSIHHHASASRF